MTKLSHQPSRAFVWILSAFVFVLLASSVKAAPLTCDGLLSVTLPAPQKGRDIGPIEFLRNLKMNIMGSKQLRKFDAAKYEETVNSLRSTEALKAGAFVPKTVEEFAALMDMKLAALNMSTQKMDPIFRHKAYQLIQKILSSSDNLASGGYSKNLTEVIFRGHFQKTTSFAYLLTHTPKATGSEMLLQHLHTLMVTDLVLQTSDTLPGMMGPVRPGLFARMSPAFVRENKEIVRAGGFFGLSLVTAIAMQDFMTIGIAKANAFELKNNSAKIQEALMQESPNETFVTLERDLSRTQTGQYVYSVVEKALNWVALIYVVGPLLLG